MKKYIKKFFTKVDDLRIKQWRNFPKKYKKRIIALTDDDSEIEQLVKKVKMRIPAIVVNPDILLGKVEIDNENPTFEMLFSCY